MSGLLSWQAWKFVEGRSIGYFFEYLIQLPLQTGLTSSLVWLVIFLLLAVLSAFILLILLPRVVEDYVKIYNWYINSDFYLLLTEKVDMRLFFRLLLLPFALLLSCLFFLVNLAVRVAYDLTYRLNLLRCVNCGTAIACSDSTVLCHICGDKVAGPATHTCPGCHFKANAVRCPYCGFVVFISLVGQHPSSKAGKKA